MTYRLLDPPRFNTPAPATWATQVADDFTALWPDRPTILLYRNAATSVANNTNVHPSWTHARYQVGEWWTSGATITAPRTGFYVVIVSVDWEGDTSGIRTIKVGDHTDTAKPEDSAGYASQNFVTFDHWTEGDPIEVTYRQNSGGSLDVNPGDPDQHDKQSFAATWLGSFYP